MMTVSGVSLRLSIKKLKGVKVSTRLLTRRIWHTMPILAMTSPAMRETGILVDVSAPYFAFEDCTSGHAMWDGKEGASRRYEELGMRDVNEHDWVTCEAEGNLPTVLLYYRAATRSDVLLPPSRVGAYQNRGSQSWTTKLLILAKRHGYEASSEVDPRIDTMLFIILIGFPSHLEAK